MSTLNASDKIQNIFVLMLENRSFDHMLGFSGIFGTDAETGKPTSINGVNGSQSNAYGGQTYPVTEPADYKMPFDPGHEFTDAVTQLSGLGATYPKGGPYPPIDNSGFVADYATTKSPGEGGATSNFGEIMKCYSSRQLPVMNTLAKEFAVCDNWFSALPGPTWPNRFFVMAASSGGLDHSPSTGEILEWETFDGFSFPNGSLFDLVNDNNLFGARVYRGDKGPTAGSVPIAAALKNMSVSDTFKFSDFANHLNQASYPWPFTFIEPNYGDIMNNSYEGGTSQHPMDDVRNGEALIKEVYETIRNSPHWENSLLLITYDEHGGFYDHVAPPRTVPPGDGSDNSSYNQYGFTFDQLGVRVPALVISPYVARNTIDHRVYQHSSVPKMVSNILGLPNLTERDAAAADPSQLITLPQPRQDTPKTLPSPPADLTNSFTVSYKDPNEAIAIGGNLAGFLSVALKEKLKLAPAYDHQKIKEEYAAISTRGQAEAFLTDALNAVDRYHMMSTK